eukprot:1904164-Alexandrium_andersonii.AAC.1
MACRRRRPWAAPKRTTARLSPATVLAPAVRGPLQRRRNARAPPHASAVWTCGVVGMIAAAQA